ncbi:MAG: alpha/beta fold hydrolase [Patescibacteria group bacterium]|jgi:pimeloyl-ACP methyl ester carboxylesterase
MNAEFIRFTTEDKLILQGIIYRPNNSSEKAYLHIHGMAGNFYENRFLDAMAKELTDNCYAFMSINTRGHDYIADFPIAGPEEKSKKIGDAYEIFEECLLDIKPAIDYLQKHGYKEIILCGHSLGAVKVAYYITKTQDQRVNKLILMSPPDMVGLTEKENDSEKTMEQAKKMVSEGKGNELLPGLLWGWYYLSANTYLNFSVRDNPIDIFNTYDKAKLSLLSEIRIPTLAFLGEKDDAAIMSPREALEIMKSKATQAPIFDIDIIPSAPHSYFSHEREMVQKIVSWLLI